jgi:hypothetical protein
VQADDASPTVFRQRIAQPSAAAMAEEVNMIDQDNGRGRTPGPMGRVAGGGGRRPGPLGFGLWAITTPLATAAVKTLKMPLPASDGKTKVVRAVTTWSLGKDNPVPDDVEQNNIPTCAVASILAALANTAVGRTRIGALVDEKGGVVVTDLSDVPVDPNFVDRPQGNKITSNRYFTVTLTMGSAEVSDVFYTDEGDEETWSMIYMDSPNKNLWPCVIEKGYADLLGHSYDRFAQGLIEIGGKTDANLTAQAIWKNLAGKDPKTLVVKDLAPSEITAIAATAKTVPAMAASLGTAKKPVTNSHGFAVLGLSGSAIELYDPNLHDPKDRKKKKITLSLDDFQSNFNQILTWQT